MSNNVQISVLQFLNKEYVLKDTRDLDVLLSDLNEVFSEFSIYSFIKIAIVEFVMNSFKGFHKRLFFKNNKYNFEFDYEKGNRDFIEKLKDGEQLTVSSEINPDTIFNTIDEVNSIKFKVSSNYVLSEDEKRKIDEIFVRSIKKFDDGGSSEGAGIGLKMILNGLDIYHLPIESIGYSIENNRTIFFLNIPKHKLI